MLKRKNGPKRLHHVCSMNPEKVHLARSWADETFVVRARAGTIQKFHALHPCSSEVKYGHDKCFNLGYPNARLAGEVIQFHF